MFVSLRYRVLAITAMGLLGVIAFNLARGTIAIEEAATRALILVVVAVCVDRLVMPILMVMIGVAPRQRVDAGEDDETRSAT